MRGYGITYDTGFVYADISDTRPQLDPAIVEREMRVIRDDLHCTAVRVTGGDADRLEIAARHAAAAGLEVWFAPFTCDLTQDELLAFLTDCADRAERLRGQGTEVVFLTGAELALFTRGFLPGKTLDERLALLAEPARLREAIGAVPPRINPFLGTAVAAVRERFGGKVTYASIPFEGVDWTPFDFVSVDAYRTAEIAHLFQDSIRALVAQGKPVAVTEFGCATYRGAADLGARADAIVEYEGGTPVRLTEDTVRDEDEQATCLGELFDVFEEAGVDSAFVCTFASYHLPHRADPTVDLDRASYGIVKVLENGTGETYPGLSWEPKAAFHELAKRHSRRG